MRGAKGFHEHHDEETGDAKDDRNDQKQKEIAFDEGAEDRAETDVRGKSHLTAKDLVVCQNAEGVDAVVQVADLPPDHSDRQQEAAKWHQ